MARATNGTPPRADLAKHLDLSRAGLSDLIARGVLPQAGTQDEYRVTYLRHLRGRAAGWVSEDGLDLASERARLAKEQADRIAMDNAEARGEAARWDDVESFVVPLLSATVQRALAVPAKAAPEAHGAETIAASEAAIREHQVEALRELADVLAGAPAEVRRRVGAEAAERRGRLRKRAAPAEPVDGQRVGGG